MPFSRRRDRGGEPLTLFYAADLHGSERCFRKFLNAAGFYDADLLVLGGDLTGKGLVPIVGEAKGTWSARFLGRTVSASDEPELLNLESQIRFNGFYPYRTDPDELAELHDDPDRLSRVFDEQIRADVARWMEIAESKLASTTADCLIMPGNDDPEYVSEILSGSDRLVNPEGEVLEVGGLQFLSLGYSNRTPWNTPRELPEEELARRISEMGRRLEPHKPTVFNLHVPPYDTGIDSAPEIDENLRLKGGAAARMAPVGSTAVRQALEEHQPTLGLHGHIHESQGVARLGQTVCLNPGSEYNVGVLRGVLVRMQGDRFVGHQFVAA